MHEFLPGLGSLKLPTMWRVRQEFDRTCLSNVRTVVQQQFERRDVQSALSPGSTVAVAVGSRGIADLPVVVKTLCDQLKSLDVKVFIIPSMGSHGGATALGQKKMLAQMGISEKSIGVPIRSSMEAVEVGRVRSSVGREIPIYMDKLAHDQADTVIPVVRVKPHTGFKGPVESGICKMLTIGMGKHVGCALLHRQGFKMFDQLIPDAAKVVLGTGKISFVLAIVENAYEQVAVLEAVMPAKAISREKELLVEAKKRLARLLLSEIDVLVVDRFGKNISGVGMDANVTGRGELGMALAGFEGPEISRIVVLALTSKTNGNAHGIGLADIVTEKVCDQINQRTTWTNTLTAGSLACGRIPIALPTEEQAIMAAASCVPGVQPEEAKIVRIHHTLALTEIAVSESLKQIVDQTDQCEVVGKWNGKWK